MTYSPLYLNKKQLKNIRTSLRKNQTKSESLLWSKLRRKQIGYIFRRQFSIGNFVIHFYCNELKLIIEVDGNMHGENKEKSVVSVFTTNPSLPSPTRGGTA